MNPDLSTLRGIHLPTGGGSALQGEVVAAIALGFAAALLVGLLRLLRARMQASTRRAALRELALAHNLDPETRRVAQARLLRRVVRTLRGDEAAASRGATWARELDGTFATDFFSRGAGQALVEGLYRRPQASDAAVIDAELSRLFSKLRA